MKKLFTYSPWCIALFFTLMTFQSSAQNDCGTAVSIGSIPFSSGAQTTCGTVNDFAAGFSTCVSSNYGAGEDYVYSISITTAPVTYTLTLGGAATWKIASVHSACPPAGANCVGGIATSSGTSASGNVTFPTNGTYYIIIDTWPDPTCGAFTLDITIPPPPPANDNCAGAIPFGTIPNDGICVNASVTTVSATGAADAVCTGTEDDDVWYTFTTPPGVTTILYTNTNVSGNTDRVHQLYSGTCAGLTSLGCFDAESGSFTGLTGSTTYYLRTYTWSAGVTTTFNLCLRTPPPPPANDNCAGALPVTVNGPGLCTSQTAGTVAGATASTGAPAICAGTADDDVWFSFVATTASVSLALNNVTGSTSDLVHQVVSGVCGTQVQVSCSDPNTSTASGLTIGQTYYIRVFTWTATTGQTSAFNVCVSEIPPPPANDACAGAITISGCTSVNGTTLGATGDALTTSCNSVSVSSTSQGVWYRFVGDGNPVEVNTCSPGTGFDTKIHVYSGSCGTFTCVTGNDDSSPLDPACDLSGSNRKSKVNWTSTLGVTYFIYVYPFTNPGGNFTLNLISGPPCAAPAPVSSNISSTSATISWAAAPGAVSYSYSFGSGVHTCGTGAVVQAGTSVNLTNLIPNTSYTFCVRTNCACGSSTYSTVNFMTNPLPNDACAGAIPLACNSTVNGSTVGAVSDSGQGSCGIGNGATPGNGVWYSLAGDGSQITLDLCGSAYDTKVHVYSGSCAGLTCVISNDDNAAICTSATTRSQVVFNTTAGTTYYILVSGFGTATGAFSMNVGCVCGAPLSFPWSNNAIGANTVGEGIDNVCGGSIDISSNGYSPSLASDAFFFSSQSLCGNQSITVKVQNITNGGFAGIMFRDTVSAGSRFIAIKTQLNPFVHREVRSVANGARQVAQVPAPGHTWLRLTRNGNVFTGFTSHNGVNWSQAFSVNLILNNCVRVGLLAQGLNPASTAQAQFTNVSGFPATVITLPNMNSSINEGTQGVTVFPNPASSELNLKIGTEYLGKNVTINVMDQMGRTVLTRNINELQTQMDQINVSSLPAGMYILSLVAEGHTAQLQKFIVSGNRP